MIYLVGSFCCRGFGFDYLVGSFYCRGFGVGYLVGSFCCRDFGFDYLVERFFCRGFGFGCLVGSFPVVAFQHVVLNCQSRISNFKLHTVDALVIHQYFYNFVKFLFYHTV